MVSNVQSGGKADNPKSVVTRVSRECSSKGIFVGSVGSVSVKEGDHIFVGPSPSLIRPSELEEEHIFQVSAENGSVIAEPAPTLQLKIHEMSPLHLEIYKANPTIGCVLECRSTSSIVASLMIKGKRLTIKDPEIVLGPTENKKSVYIPVIDACSELPALAKKIASELKSQAAAASAASVTSATPAKTTTETEVKTEEPVKETTAAEIEGDSTMDDPELLEIKPTEDDIIDKDEEMNEDESAEIQGNVDLDQIRCSAVIVRNKGFFVWAKTWTECLNRAEQINQMLEICNQMKLMGFNVYAHLMAAANPHQSSNQRKNSYKKQDKNGEKNSATSLQKSTAQNEATGGTAPKRPRIEPPVSTNTDEKKESAEGEVANKKRKWVNKKRGRQQQDQPVQQQPQQQAPKQTQNVKKEPIKTPLQRPAPGRYPSQERGIQNNTRGRRGGQPWTGSGSRGAGMHGRLGQVPSPWAQPQMQQNPWFGY